MTTGASLPDDATLVAWLDGELPDAVGRRVLAAARSDANVHRRLQLLRAARAEFAWALERPDQNPPALAAVLPPGVARRAGTLLLAAAAVAVVLVLAVTARRASRDVAAENEWLALKLVPVQTGWDLFSGIRFELEGTARSATPCRVVARKPHESDAQLADRVFADESSRAALPLVLEAEVTGPDGVARRGDVVRAEGSWTQVASRLTIELVDVQLSHAGISPVLNVALDPDGVREDFWWGIRRCGTTDAGGRHGFVPEQVGEYRIGLTLRSFTAPGDSRFLRFAAPLSVAAGFAVRGVVGAWSPPTDGMRARIVVNRERPDAGHPLVFAVQLRNESDRARRLNVTGSTIAKIPQPFHFDLLVDGEPWSQRDDLGVITPAMSTGLVQAVSSERSVVVLADCWRRDGRAPSSLAGKHTLAVRFHFEASVFEGTDTELWQGRIDTPAIEVELRSK